MFLSLLLSFLISMLFDKRILKIIVFSFSISIFLSIWFKYPGQNVLAPILSIFLLENLILENNGFLRLFRPFILSFFITFLLSLFFWKKDLKS